jgi:hypothetical protein
MAKRLEYAEEHHQFRFEHWHFGSVYNVDEYIALQARHVLGWLIADERHAEHAHLLG